jgi:hypothetical protein
MSLDDTAEDGKIELLVEYTIRANNTRHNLVFPFYLDEGNLVLSDKSKA